MVARPDFPQPLTRIGPQPIFRLADALRYRAARDGLARRLWTPDELIGAARLCKVLSLSKSTYKRRMRAAQAEVVAA